MSRKDDPYGLKREMHKRMTDPQYNAYRLEEEMIRYSPTEINRYFPDAYWEEQERRKMQNLYMQKYATRPFDTEIQEILKGFVNKVANKVKEENEPEMSRTSVSDQAEIDEAVREAITAPRRLREIALRVAAVEAIGIDDEHEEGTVLCFKRKDGKNVFGYVSFKIGDDQWITMSSNTANGCYGQLRTWEELTTWMTTGTELITDLQVSSGWTDITWSAPAPAPTPAPTDAA